jgi:hypothetical protein
VVRWLLSRAQGIADSRRRQIRIVRDITEEAMERVALPMRELDWQVKSAPAVVSAAACVPRAKDPRVSSCGVEGRVTALARAHTALADAPGNACASLRAGRAPPRPADRRGIGSWDPATGRVRHRRPARR